MEHRCSSRCKIPQAHGRRCQLPAGHRVVYHRSGPFSWRDHNDAKRAEEQACAEAIVAARTVQTFLWGETNGAWGWEEWLRMFRKRVAKLEEVKRDNPHATVEVRKRLLQTAALAIAMMGLIDRTGVPWEAQPTAPPSNLPQFATPLTPEK